MIVTYNYCDNVERGVYLFICTTEAEGIVRLAGIMKECSGTRPDFNRILDTAIEHAKKGETNEAFQCLDTWVEEFSQGDSYFHFKFKDHWALPDDDRCPHGMFYTGAGACPACGG